MKSFNDVFYEGKTGLYQISWGKYLAWREENLTNTLNQHTKLSPGYNLGLLGRR